MIQKQKRQIKRGHIINWLTMMREDGHLHIPVHKMNASNWFKAYQDANTGNDDALFGDKKYFILQMNKIATLHLFGGFYKSVIRSPKYKVFYEVRSIQHQNKDDEDITATEYDSSLPANESLIHLTIDDPVAVPQIELQHRPFLSDLIEYHANNDQGLQVLERLLSPTFLSALNQSVGELNTASTDTLITSQLQSASQSLSTSQLQSFIDRLKLLRFDIHPRPSLKNVTNPSLSAINIIALNTRQRFSESMKWSLIAILADLGIKEVPTVKTRKEIMKAVIVTQSYVYGYNQPVISVDYLERLWKKYCQSLTVDPTLTSTIFKSRAGQGKVSKVTYLANTYPTFLHSIYRYSTSVLGCTANAIGLVSMMNSRSLQLYPDCPDRSQLGFTRHHFWIFFKMYNGKLIRSNSSPRLILAHV